MNRSSMISAAPSPFHLPLNSSSFVYEEIKLDVDMCVDKIYETLCLFADI